jgi:hypothetical protein
MVDQVRAHSRRVQHRGDAEGFKIGAGADARAEQDGGRGDGSCRERDAISPNDLAPRDLHAHRATSLDDDAVHESVRADVEVR